MTHHKTNLTVLGVNYKKTSLEIRNKFALTFPAIQSIYEEKSGDGDDFFILSTCNRTEIYTLSEDPEKMLGIFRRGAALENEIREYTYLRTGDDAIRHLFRVASGIDSQILGDYEIVGQIKRAFNHAKSNQRTSGMMERLINTSLKTSKQVRTSTNISDGTTSVSYAVVQLLRQAALHDPSRRICLMGLGKIGALTLKNLRHYLPDNKITLINRNQAKAEALAETYHVSSAPISAQAAVLRETDILIVATGADHAIISSSDVAGTPVKMIFDLSVPSNVSEDVKQLPGITFYDIDHLSDIVNETLIKRQKEIPLAESIIEENLTEYSQWKIRRDSYHRSAETENGNDE